jgi:hypothetical protein
MGKLSFSRLRFSAIDDETVNVRGRWQLARRAAAASSSGAANLGGSFVLVMRRVGRAWRVAVDYTTVDARR